MNKTSMTEWDLFWMTWMLFFCVGNCAAVLLCTYFVVVHFYEDTEETQQIQEIKSNNMASIKMSTHGARNVICPTYGMLTKIKTVKCDGDSTSVCGKRKSRDNRFGMTDEIVQGKQKQRRRVVRTRAFSFNDVTTLLQQPQQTSPLRRAASCGDMDGASRSPASEPSASETVHSSAALASKHAFKQDLHDSVVHFKIHVRSFVARNAIDEVLTSVFSSMAYATLLFIVRQYSAVAIGVSLDLGAFSIAL
ncbi:hypothetical protein FI667_g9933, partial [Globisporangium splendens]